MYTGKGVRAQELRHSPSPPLSSDTASDADGAMLQRAELAEMITPPVAPSFWPKNLPVSTLFSGRLPAELCQ